MASEMLTRAELVELTSAACTERSPPLSNDQTALCLTMLDQVIEAQCASTGIPEHQMSFDQWESWLETAIQAVADDSADTTNATWTDGLLQKLTPRWMQKEAAPASDPSQQEPMLEEANYALADDEGMDSTGNLSKLPPPTYEPPSSTVADEPPPFEESSAAERCVLEPPEEKEPGFFSRIFSRGKTENTAAVAAGVPANPDADSMDAGAAAEAEAAETPPESCQLCSVEFSSFLSLKVSQGRAVCPMCQQHICKGCLSHEVQLTVVDDKGASKTKSTKVCDPCKIDWLHQQLQERRDERMAIVQGFITAESEFQPRLHEPVETNTEVAVRLGGAALSAAKGIASLLPLGTYKNAVKYTLKGTDLCRKYGVYGIASLALKNDFVEAIEIIRTLTGKVEADMTDLSAGMFYFFASKRGERGNDPDAEAREHAQCEAANPDRIAHFVRNGPFALCFAYSDKPWDTQRLLRQQGFELLFQEKPTRNKEQPGYYLVSAASNVRCCPLQCL